MTKGLKLFNYLAESCKYEEYPEKCTTILADLILLQDEEFDKILEEKK
jgi:hypothetical protein